MSITFDFPQPLVVRDRNGVPIPSAHVFFYAQGTLVLTEVFKDAARTEAFAQPIVANQSGELPVIYPGTYDFTVEIKDGNGCTLITMPRGVWRPCPIDYITSTQLLREYTGDGPVLALLDGSVCPRWYHVTKTVPTPVEDIPRVVTGICKTWELCDDLDAIRDALASLQSQVDALDVRVTDVEQCCQDNTAALQILSGGFSRILVNPTVFVRPTGDDNNNDGSSVSQAFETLDGMVDYISESLIVGDLTIDAQGTFDRINFGPTRFPGAGRVRLVGDQNNIAALTIRWGNGSNNFDHGIFATDGLLLEIAHLTLEAFPSSDFASAIRSTNAGKIVISGDIAITGTTNSNQNLLYATGSASIATEGGTATNPIGIEFDFSSPLGSAIVARQYSRVGLSNCVLQLTNGTIPISGSVFSADRGGLVDVSATPQNGYPTNAVGLGSFDGPVLRLTGTGASMRSGRIAGLTDVNLHTHFLATGPVQSADISIGAYTELDNGIKHGTTGATY